MSGVTREALRDLERRAKLAIEAAEAVRADAIERHDQAVRECAELAERARRDVEICTREVIVRLSGIDRDLESLDVFRWLRFRDRLRWLLTGRLPVEAKLAIGFYAAGPVAAAHRMYPPSAANLQELAETPLPSDGPDGRPGRPGAAENVEDRNHANADTDHDLGVARDRQAEDPRERSDQSKHGADADDRDQDPQKERAHGVASDRSVAKEAPQTKIPDARMAEVDVGRAFPEDQIRAEDADAGRRRAALSIVKPPIDETERRRADQDRKDDDTEDDGA